MKNKKSLYQIMLLLALGAANYDVVAMNQQDPAELTVQDYRRYLPEYLADQRYNDKTIEDYIRDQNLLSAVIHNNAFKVQNLIRAGANVNMQSNYGESVLSIAIVTNSKFLVQVLIDAGADVNMPGPNGEGPLCQAINGNKSGVVQVLINAGADVNMPDRNGERPLFIAIKLNKLGLVQSLIAAGADVNILESYGRTPLLEAIKLNRSGIVQAMINSNQLTSDLVVEYRDRLISDPNFALPLRDADREHMIEILNEYVDLSFLK